MFGEAGELGPVAEGGGYVLSEWVAAMRRSLDRSRIFKEAKTRDASYALRTKGAVMNNEESTTIDLLAEGK